MGTYVGSSVILSWLTSTGTTALHSDYKTLTIDETADMYDATAGPDREKQYVAGPTDRTVSLTYLQQTGTADITQLRAQQIGTLQVSPEGTAAGKPLYSYPLIIDKGASWNMAYNGMTEISVGWKSYGTLTIGTN